MVKETITAYCEREKITLPQNRQGEASVIDSICEVLCRDATDEIVDRAYRAIGVPANCRRVIVQLVDKLVSSGGVVKGEFIVDYGDQTVLDLHALAGQKVEIFSLQTELPIVGNISDVNQQEFDISAATMLVGEAQAEMDADDRLPDGYTGEQEEDTRTDAEVLAEVSGDAEPPEEVPVLYFVISPDSTVMSPNPMPLVAAQSRMEDLISESGGNPEGWRLMDEASVQENIDSNDGMGEDGFPADDEPPMMSAPAPEPTPEPEPEPAPAPAKVGLTAAQLKAAEIMVAGGTVETAAKGATVGVSTINRWLRTVPEFKVAATPAP